MKIPMVYVMTLAGGGAVKVGMSVHPDVRLTQLSGAESVAYVSEPTPDAARIEDTAHKLLAEYQHRGEWFSVSVEDAVAAIQRATRIVAGLEEDVTAGMTFDKAAKWRAENPDWNRKAECDKIQTTAAFGLYQGDMELIRQAMDVLGQHSVAGFARYAVLWFAKDVIRLGYDPKFPPLTPEQEAELDALIEEEDWEAERLAMEEFEAEEAMREEEEDLADVDDEN